MTNQYQGTNINAPRATVTVTATTALNQDADLVIVDTTGLGAPPTITLPDAREVDGREIKIKAPVATAGGGGQNVIVDGVSGQTIDGAASVTIAVDQTALTVKSDNANWRIVALTDATSGGETIFGDLFLDAASPTLTNGNGLGSPVLALNKSDAGTAEFQANVAGVRRWDLLFDANEDLSLERRNAAGVLQDVPIFFDAAAGNVAIANSLLQGGAAITDGPAGFADGIFGDGTGSRGLTVFSGGGAATGGLNITNNTGVLDVFYQGVPASNRAEIGVNGAVQLNISALGTYPELTGKNIGLDTNRWAVGFMDHVQYAVLVVGDGGTDSLGAEKLVQATAPTATTTLNLPTAVAGDEYWIDAVDTTNPINVVANTGDTINGGVAGGTAGISAAAGLYHIYAVDATDWRLHGPIAVGPASA